LYIYCDADVLYCIAAKIHISDVTKTALDTGNYDDWLFDVELRGQVELRVTITQ